MKIYKLNPTYHTETLKKSRAGGKYIQDTNYSLERFHHFAIISSKFSKSTSLLLKDCDDRLGRIANFELPNEWVVAQSDPRLLFIVPHGSREERLKHRTTLAKVTHINGSRNMARYREICLVGGRGRE